MFEDNQLRSHRHLKGPTNQKACGYKLCGCERLPLCEGKRRKRHRKSYGYQGLVQFEPYTNTEPYLPSLKNAFHNASEISYPGNQLQLSCFLHHFKEIYC
ncbi:hypothetical protein KIL84_015842 [Mauremys mutica]|uniref:Uncharacterized protein n=1 Tax=Mauremys mutica TaxID=74926 RepID=A0A9D3WTA1_9SAUR|nr:hypothetical protein KIL84_015842 [Mauremys mutica]